jgi:GntR family transcriptional regulator
MESFHITISTGTGTAIYRQIIEQVRLGVATGQLQPGDPLPSVRSLADRLLVNANTVAKAYAELVREGALDSRQGQGYLVARQRRQIYSRAERRRRLRQALDAFLHEAIRLNFTADAVREAVDERLTELDLKPRTLEREGVHDQV